MKHLLLFIAVTLLSTGTYADESYSNNDGTGAPLPKWSGFVQSDIRLQTHDSTRISWQKNLLDMKLEAKPSDGAKLFTEIQMKYSPNSEVATTNDLGQRVKVFPVTLGVREAYMDILGFPNKNVDLRIGRQRIAWGTADKLNPTDNLDPADLEDIWDFGQHSGSDALKATCYIGALTITGVVIPQFTPALLPSGEWAQALSPSMSLPPNMPLGKVTTNVTLPSNNIEKTASAGIKVGGRIVDYDLSLSYVYTRDHLPIISDIEISPSSEAGKVDVLTGMEYPQNHILGADFAGNICNVGVWAEAAAFFPKKLLQTTNVTVPGMSSTNQSVALSDDPYIRSTIGLDYTFKNGIYVNGQWIHGFIHERGKKALNDYFVAGLEYKMLDDRLKITPLGIAAEICDWDDIENSYGLAFSPEISYKPVDNLDLTAGYRYLDGKENTLFGKVKDNDEAYFKCVFSF